MSPRAGKNLLILSVAQETKVPDRRIAVSMHKVSVKINPFLVGLICPRVNRAEHSRLYNY